MLTILEKQQPILAEVIFIDYLNVPICCFMFNFSNISFPIVHNSGIGTVFNIVRVRFLN